MSDQPMSTAELQDMNKEVAEIADILKKCELKERRIEETKSTENENPDNLLNQI